MKEMFKFGHELVIVKIRVRAYSCISHHCDPPYRRNCGHKVLESVGWSDSVLDGDLDLFSCCQSLRADTSLSLG